MYEKNVYNDDLTIDVNLCYFGDCEMSFSLNMIEGGIRNVESESALRVIFKPHVPFVSLIQIYFLRHPMVNFELTSALASLDLFSTGDLIRSILKEQIAKHLVFPNKIDIKLKPHDDVESSIFKMSKIEGVVRIKIISVEDIQDKSPIRVKIELDNKFEETKFVEISNGEAQVNETLELMSYKNGDDELKVSLSEKVKDTKIAEIGR